MHRLLRIYLACFAVVAVCTAQSYLIDTVVGSYSVGDGGAAKDALFWSPLALVVDSSGNVFVADSEHHRVRRIAPDGTISTVAGTGIPGFSGDDGPAVSAMLNAPNGLALDQDGNLYVADRNNHRIRKVSPDGKIITVAGDGTAGYAGDGQKATSAKLWSPQGLGVDKAGVLYIADSNNHCLRKVTADGIISTLAGTGTSGFSGDGQPAKDARLNLPRGNIVFDADGNLYFSDTYNLRVRRITPAGGISTIAGGAASFNERGLATQTSLGNPDALAFDAAGNLYIAETAGHRVRKVAQGSITTIAGTGTYGWSGDGGPAEKALVANPRGMGVDASGAVYFCDFGTHHVRKVAGGTISTIGGRSHFGGDNGPAKDALLFAPRATTYDKNGNMYIADTNNHRVRKVTPSGTIITVAGSSDIGGYSGDGLPATSARLNTPSGVAVDADGNVYIGDSANHRIRRVTAADGKISTFAGTGSAAAGGDTGPAKAALLNYPRGLALDKSGNLFVADTNNHRIRKITPQGIITTVAGANDDGFSGDGGMATGAMLRNPAGVAVDAQGAIYIADTGNGRIRKIEPSGIINTLVQNSNPDSVVVDTAGNAFFPATGSNRIQRFTPAKVMTTIAGAGTAGFSGDGGFATMARMWAPLGIALDPQGNTVFADQRNHRIRRLSVVVPAQLTIVSGDEQTGAINQALAAPLVVKVTTATGLGMPGIRVLFAIASGQGKLSATSVNTGPDGTAGVTFTLGANPGPIAITATVTGLEEVRFTATAVREPKINSIRSIAGTSELTAPGSVISIFGTALGTGTIRAPGESDLVDGYLPTKFQGTCVMINGEPAPIANLGASQANVQVSPVIAEGEASVQVLINCGTEDEAKSNVASITVQSAAPDFLLYRREADGRGPINATRGSARIGPSSLGTAYVPAKPGDTLALMCTGLGTSDPPVEVGKTMGRRAPITGSLSMTIGELAVPPENIVYAGTAPNSFGNYRIEVILPDGVADGEQIVVLTVNGYSSPANGYLTIQQ